MKRLVLFGPPDAARRSRAPRWKSSTVTPPVEIKSSDTAATLRFSDPLRNESGEIERFTATLGLPQAARIHARLGLYRRRASGSDVSRDGRRVARLKR
jgi:hypothetical protein